MRVSLRNQYIWSPKLACILKNKYIFRKGSAHGIILWTKGLFVLVLCKRLASHPFHTLFSQQHKCTHTHLPQHFTPAPCSIMNIFMSGRVLREIPCIKLNTFLSSVFRQTDTHMHTHKNTSLEKTLKDKHKLDC